MKNFFITFCLFISYTSIAKFTKHQLGIGLGSVLFNALNVPATQNVYDATGALSLVPNTTGLGNEIINQAN